MQRIASLDVSSMQTRGRGGGSVVASAIRERRQSTERSTTRHGKNKTPTQRQAGKRNAAPTSINSGFYFRQPAFVCLHTSNQFTDKEIAYNSM